MKVEQYETVQKYALLDDEGAAVAWFEVSDDKTVPITVAWAEYEKETTLPVCIRTPEDARRYIVERTTILAGMGVAQ